MDEWGLVCDPGVDDAFALVTLAGMGAVPTHVVAVPGNVDAVTAGWNAAGLVGLLGLGASVWSIRGLEHVTARVGSGRHGDDGLGGQAGRLPVALAPVTAAAGGLPASLLVTGPLSAVHLALGAGRAFDRVLWMGGGTSSEFNAASDPVATEAVLAACAGVLTQVPIGITAQVALTVDDVDRLAGGAVAAQLLAAAVHARVAAGHGYVHDAVAAVAWSRPDLFTWSTRTDAPTVAVGVDADAVHDLIVQSVLGP